MIVYLGTVSGNSYKLRILLSLLKVPHEVVTIDLANKQHKSADFLKINPRGEVPALEDGGKVIWDSAACLVYIARKYGSEQWLPADPAGMAEVMQWMALAATELQCGLQYARRGVVQGRWTLGTLEDGQKFGRVALDVAEAQLQKHDWLALDRPTIAEPACFPYIETAPEAKVALEEYPAIIKWMERCRKLPGWAGR
ncbi:MAG TPA: glutathione S-transferase family protein [Burkholderiales bacterium]|nr:glutathione S-transferase family protein [Burkholderiales bacterium]